MQHNYIYVFVIKSYNPRTKQTMDTLILHCTDNTQIQYIHIFKLAYHKINIEWNTMNTIDSTYNKLQRVYVDARTQREICCRGNPWRIISTIKNDIVTTSKQSWRPLNRLAMPVCLMASSRFKMKLYIVINWTRNDCRQNWHILPFVRLRHRA